MTHPTDFNLSLEFDDVDALGECIPDWDVEFRQLEPGSFRGIIAQVGRDGWVAARARIARATEQVGQSPTGVRTIVISGPSGSCFSWRGHQIDGEHLMVFPENGELHAVANKSFDILTLSFKPEDLWREARKSGLPDADSLLDNLEVLEVRPAEMAALRRCLNGITHGPSHPSQGTHKGPNPLRVLTDCLVDTTATTPHSSRRKRDQALAKAVQILRKDRMGAIPISLLVARLGVSARTLDTAFLDEYGLTPSAFRKALRLNQIHRQLHRAAPTTRIQDIAKSFGFVHMSQFATDYRNHFGILPSESLGAGVCPLDLSEPPF